MLKRGGGFLIKSGGYAWSTQEDSGNPGVRPRAEYLWGVRPSNFDLGILTAWILTTWTWRTQRDHIMEVSLCSRFRTCVFLFANTETVGYICSFSLSHQIHTLGFRAWLRRAANTLFVVRVKLGIHSMQKLSYSHKSACRNNLTDSKASIINRGVTWLR